MQITNSKKHLKKYQSGKCTSKEKAMLEHYNPEVNLSQDYIGNIEMGLTYKVFSSKNEQVAKKQFGGLISRSGKLSEVLCVLEATGDVHFKIEGRKATVMQ